MAKLEVKHLMGNKKQDSAASDYYNDDQSFSREDITVVDASSLARTVGGTAIGNFTEWFDFGVYSYVVVIISEVFFANSGWGKVATFAGLAVSFLFRPIGGVFWGFLGDRIGRKKVLAFTIIMMALGTFLVGLVPGYAAIGIWAPVLLFVLRAVQGFSTGGEYVDAMTYLVEHSPDRRRGHLCSFLPLGTLSGYIFGALLVILMQVLLPHDAMYSWGWRVPFLVALPLGLVGFYVRSRLKESAVYKKAAEKEGMAGKSGLQQFKETVSEHWRPIIVCIGLVLAFNVTNYMLTGYMPTYLHSRLDVAETDALIMIVVIMAILAIIVTFLGRVSDHVGKKPILYAGSILLVAVSIPMFLLMLRGGTTAVFLGTLPMGLMLVCFLSTEPSTLPTLFPTNVRSGATAISFNISVSAFGGTTPLIAATLVESTGNVLIPAYILVFAGVVGIVSVFFLPEPVGTPLRGSGPTVQNKQEARELADDSSATHNE